MTVEEWLGKDNTLGQDIFNHKYLYTKEDGTKETFDEWLERVSAGDEAIKDLIIKKKFLFGGRILANRGLEKYGVKTTYSNCYVITPPEDNIESIFETAKKMARTYSYGGGVGVDISGLAPNGAKVHNASRTSSGACSFMDLYSTTTGLIGQNGRRGALMISLSCEHPDIEEFLDIKKDLNRVTKANISVRMTDKFMEAAKAGKDVELSFTRETGETIKKTVNAREILMHLAKNNWEMAEPGCLFWDRIQNWNLVSEDPEFEFAGTNPCFSKEMRLLTVDGYKTFEELDGTEPLIVNADGDVVKSKVWCSGEKEVVKLIFENHQDIVCTPNHIYRAFGGSEVMAKDVKGVMLEKPSFDQYDSGYLVKDVIPAGKAKVYDFTEPLTHWGIVEGVVAHNCAEEPLPAGGSCLLGSINLAEFVYDDGNFMWNEFQNTVRISIRALNDVLIEGLPLHPLKEQRDSVRDWRQIGLGIMGLADMLIKMGIRYGSEEAVEVCDKIGRTMARTALKQSYIMASQNGAYPKYKYENVINSGYLLTHLTGDNVCWLEKHGLYNSQLLTIAPTGTLSTMIRVSGGIEPIFANYYTRKTESLKGHDEYYKVYTPIVKEYMDKHGITDDKDLPDFFVTAGELDYKDRIAMQAVWQKHIDAAISSTVNLSNDTTVEDIFDLYIKAWEAGLKGITVFRDGCARAAILSTGDVANGKETNDTPDETKRGYIIPASDDLIGLKRSVVSGCGKLHVEAFFTRDTGELRELFLSKGSKGGCNSFMSGFSRITSLAARGGIPFEAIVDQLQSTIVCPSFATRRATKHDTSRGSSCPNAVGYALIDMKQEAEAIVKALNGDTIFTGKKEETIEDVKLVECCPNCGSKELSHTEGCVTCPACGWSRCS